MDFKNQIVLRKIIISHYQNPNKKGFVSETNSKTYRINSSECIDDIAVEITPNNNSIKTARFEGLACTITTASTDILCELIENTSFAIAKKIIKEFESMIHGKSYDENILGQAVAFKNTYKQPNRIKCALMGSEVIKELLNKI